MRVVLPYLVMTSLVISSLTGALVLYDGAAAYPCIVWEQGKTIAQSYGLALLS